MSKFKEGDGIVRNKNNPNYYAPMGYKTKALKNHRCKLKDGTTIPIVDDNWELAEDTSKPVTEEYKGNIYEIGQDYLFRNNGSSLTYSKLENIIFSDAYPFKTVNCNYKYIEEVPSSKHLGTITPAPVPLIHGKAYTFDNKGASYIGIYASPPHRFINVDGFTLSSYCTNIRLMTVAESK